MNKTVITLSILGAFGLGVLTTTFVNQHQRMNYLEQKLANAPDNSVQSLKTPTLVESSSETSIITLKAPEQVESKKIVRPDLNIEDGERIPFSTNVKPFELPEIPFRTAPSFVEQQRMKLQGKKHQHISQQQLNHPEMIDNAALVTDAMVYGNEDARFRIVTYSDVECPYCRKMHPHVKTLVDYSKGNIAWEYKHYPLANHNPAAAVQAAMINCAFAEKGNQWAWLMLGEMIKHTGGNGRGQGNYNAFAEHINVESQWLEKCVSNQKYQAKVESDYQEGMDLGIRSTPTSVIIDTQTGASKILRGFQSAEDLAKYFYKIDNLKK